MQNGTQGQMLQWALAGKAFNCSVCHFARVWMVRLILFLRSIPSSLLHISRHITGRMGSTKCLNWLSLSWWLIGLNFHETPFDALLVVEFQEPLAISSIVTCSWIAIHSHSIDDYFPLNTCQQACKNRDRCIRWTDCCIFSYIVGVLNFINYGKYMLCLFQIRQLQTSAVQRDIDQAAKYIGAGAATVGAAGSGTSP